MVVRNITNIKMEYDMNNEIIYINLMSNNKV